MLNRLKSLQAQEKLDAAQASFARILAEAPDHLHAWLGLGYCASLNGDAKAAARAIETAVGLGPSDDDAAIDCSAALSHLGRPDAARDILVARPDSRRQQIALGELEEQQGRFDDSLIRYEAAHARDPTSDLPLRKMISLHRHRGSFSTALAVTQRLEAMGPPHVAVAWHLRGQIRSAMNDRNAAIAALRMALHLSPLSESVAIDLSRALRDIREDDAARAILADRPATYHSLLALGELALWCQDHDAALRHAVAAQMMQPSRPEPLARIAAIEADRGNHDAAREAVAKMEAHGPEHCLIKLRSRLALFRAEGDERGVLNTLLDLAARQPADAGLLAELSRHYRVIGEPDAAYKALQAALAQDPCNVAILAAAGDQASQAEDRDTALDFYQRVLALAPGQLSHHLRVTRLLFDLNRLDEADEALKAAEARFGASAAIRGEHIRVLRQTGQTYQALDQAREACAAYPADFACWSDLFRLELSLSSFETARDCIDRAPVHNRGEQAQILCARAHLAMRIHESAEAIAHFEAALTLQPRSRTAREGLLRLHLRRFDIERSSIALGQLAVLDAPGRRMRGTTTNPSQSHLGQIFNDLTLDRRAVSDLTAVEAGAAHIARLLALVRKRPDHIPTAQALLVALQQGGLLTVRMAAGDGRRRPIPAHIGQFWDAPDPPRDLLALSQSWRDQNPGYGYRLFNDGTARTYLATHFPPAVLTAYRRCGDPTTKADLFRLAFLVHDGGIWADMDDRCLRPVECLIPAGADAFFWQEDTGHLCNNLMAAIPRHPILRHALVKAVNAINRGDRDKVWMLTGPGLLSRAFAVVMAGAGDAWREWLDRVAVRDEFDIHPNVAIHCQTSHKRLGKHWNRTAYSSSDSRRRQNRLDGMAEAMVTR